MSIYGGSLADLYELQEREIIWPFFALSPLLGKFSLEELSVTTGDEG